MSLSRGFLAALVATLVVLSWLLVEPFVQYVLGSLLVAFVLYPLQARLETHARSTVAALSLVLLSVVGVVAPFALLVASVADTAELVLREFDADGAEVRAAEARFEELTGRQVDIGETLAGSSQELGRILFERSAEAFGTLTYHLIGVALALFLVFYLLRDGDRLLEWLYRTVPLPRAIQRDLYGEVEDVMWGVLFGHVFVAVVQGVVAGVGFYATGIPNATFWTIVMVGLAMVPLVGAIPVWGGAVVYLYVTGEPLLAAGLFGYSVVVVGLTDDYLRPFAVDRYAKLSPAVILLGILGGAYAFGIMGLFYGPVVLGALKAALRILSENWAQLGETTGG